GFTTDSKILANSSDVFSTLCQKNKLFSKINHAHLFPGHRCLLPLADILSALKVSPMYPNACYLSPRSVHPPFQRGENHNRYPRFAVCLSSMICRWHDKASKPQDYSAAFAVLRWRMYSITLGMIDKITMARITRLKFFFT